MSNFVMNDLVKVAKLKNAPDMIVSETSGRKISCFWFSTDLNRHTETFYDEMLVKVEPPTSNKPMP